MSVQNYSTAPSRNLIVAEKRFLKHAEPYSVLGDFGMHKEQDRQKTDTVVFRRTNPVNMQANGTPGITPAAFASSEGVTPTPLSISFTDVPVTLQEYSILFKFSSKTELMYEDDIPEEMSKLTGETMGEVKELIQWGVVRGGTSVVYANGSSRSAVNTTVSLNKIRQAVRMLESARAKRITSKLAPGPDFGSAPVEMSYVAFVHTDMEADIRNLPGFKHVVEYAAQKTIHVRELGAVENVRFISSSLLSPFLAAGAAVGSSGMVAANATNIDVYPIIITAQDAWGCVPLKGFGAVRAAIISSQTRNHANPSAKFGYVGGEMWTAAVRLNENFMVRIESAASNLA